MKRSFLKPGDLRTWLYPSKKIGLCFLILDTNDLCVKILNEGNIEVWKSNTILKWSIDFPCESKKNNSKGQSDE